MEELKKIDDNSIQCVVTSPPYWGLRDYGVKGQIGLEQMPEDYVNNLVKVFSEVKRVLRQDGTIWLNLGDTYCSGGTQRFDNENYGGLGEKQIDTRILGRGRISKHPFLKPKDLCGIPFRVAFALQEKLGLYLRQAIIWHKPNAMPSSVDDRPTTDYEFIFLLSKSERYFYKMEFEPTVEPYSEKRAKRPETSRMKAIHGSGKPAGNFTTHKLRPEGRNIRTVWSFNTVPYPDAHFAVFPEELPERCIKSGTKEGDTVLDPFAGSGTTLWVAKRMNRKYIGIELSEKYIKLCNKRTAQQMVSDFNPLNEESLIAVSEKTAITDNDLK